MWTIQSNHIARELQIVDNEEGYVHASESLRI